ncbi:MAG: threonylcarbamoyl-AMP synthase [Thermoplasmata archaeon HGW-Thermoplasmata-1]|nr:MAG: threonylcarbamoyl-AMP synthase [Thermoplasmata archaeon HGW-Thermoplasmata-1]
MLFKQAVEALSDGELVVYPTETLYGLGADAKNVDAVKKVFEAKERPSGMALPVAVCDLKMMERIAEVGEVARKLYGLFLPGPLSMVLPRKEYLPKETAGGLDTVMVRVPSHSIAIDLIESFGGPITATSANIHGGKNPSSLDIAFDQLGAKIKVYLNAGHLGGTASTIVDLTTKKPAILREGAIPRNVVEDALR